jgi:hypothetical protein
MTAADPLAQARTFFEYLEAALPALAQSVGASAASLSAAASSTAARLARAAGPFAESLLVPAAGAAAEAARAGAAWAAATAAATAGNATAGVPQLLDALRAAKAPLAPSPAFLRAHAHAVALVFAGLVVAAYVVNAACGARARAKPTAAAAARS